MSLQTRVVVMSKELHDTKEFSGKNYGWQNAAIYNGGDFPAPFHVNVEVGSEYEPGDYIIDPRSYRPDDRNNLQLKRIKLLPISGSSATAKK